MLYITMSTDCAIVSLSAAKINFSSKQKYYCKEKQKILKKKLAQLIQEHN